MQPAWDPDSDTGINVSSGGLNAPIPDLLRYLAFLGGALAADAPGATVLARGSLEEMWRPVLPVGEGAAWGVLVQRQLEFLAFVR